MVRERAGSALRKVARRRLAVDRRALAAFRVGLALVLLADLARRTPDVAAFYTDSGVLPRSLLGTLYPGYETVSLHAVSGSLTFQVLLFGLAAVAALALLAGYRTRLAAVLSLVLLVSLQLRNPLVLNSGDVLLRRLLFWGLLLPLGSRWAVDSGQRPDGDVSVAGPATAGLLAQVIAVYATNAVVKLRSDVWLRGDAVRYAFELDHFTVALGNVLAGRAALLTVADWVWLGLLVVSPLLVLLTGRARAGLVTAFMCVHAGMVVTLNLGVFPLVSLVSLLPFMPTVVWDRFEQWIGVPGWLPALHRPWTPLAQRVPALSGAARAFAALCLAVLLVSNAVGLGVVGAPAGTPSQVTERSWDMFAPSPPLATWWYDAPATLTTGEQVNAITGDRYDRSRPADAADRHPNERWRKFFADARQEPRLRESLARYHCQRWNRTHDSGMTGIELWLQWESTALGGPESVQRERQEQYRCSELTAQ